MGEGGGEGWEREVVMGWEREVVMGWEREGEGWEREVVREGESSGGSVLLTHAKDGDPSNTQSMACQPHTV